MQGMILYRVYQGCSRCGRCGFFIKLQTNPHMRFDHFYKPHPHREAFKPHKPHRKKAVRCGAGRAVYVFYISINRSIYMYSTDH